MAFGCKSPSRPLALLAAGRLNTLGETGFPNATNPLFLPGGLAAIDAIICAKGPAALAVC